MNNNKAFKKKYLKYKLKYLQEKNIQTGGSNEDLQNQINKIKDDLQKLKEQFDTHYHETTEMKTK